MDRGISWASRINSGSMASLNSLTGNTHQLNHKLNDDLHSILQMGGSPSVKQRDDFAQVLQRWKDDQYPSSSQPEIPLFAMLLTHKYKDGDLDRGRACLKDQDATLLANLLPIAGRMGIVVCIANLEKIESGGVDEYDLEKVDRRIDLAWEFPDLFELDGGVPTPAMTDVDEESLTLFNLVPINTANTKWEGIEIELNQASLVPRGAFDLLTPDEKDFDGDTSTVEHIYRRSALVIYPKKDESWIQLSTIGFSDIIKKLKLNEGINARSDIILRGILSRNPGSQAISLILQAALTCKNHAIWNLAIKFVGRGNSASVGAIQRGLEVFSYDNIKPGIIALVEAQSEQKDKLFIVNGISPLFKDGIRAQNTEELKKYATSGSKPTPSSEKASSSVNIDHPGSNTAVSTGKKRKQNQVDLDVVPAKKSARSK